MSSIIRGKYFGLLVAVAGSISFLGCSDTVTIRYEQPANFYVFDKDPGGTPHTTTSAADGMFMVYKIKSIENNKAGAKDFDFKLAKLYASTVEEVSGNTSLGQWETAQDAQVAKGTSATNLGRIIIRVSGDPMQMKNAWQALHYASASGESVLLIQEPPVPTPQFLDPGTPANLP